RGDLDEHPLGAVRRPDADAIAALDTGGHQRARDATAVGPQLAIARAVASRDQRVALGELHDGAMEVRADGLVDERPRLIAARVRGRWSDLVHGAYSCTTGRASRRVTRQPSVGTCAPFAS